MDFLDITKTGTQGLRGIRNSDLYNEDTSESPIDDYLTDEQKQYINYLGNKAVSSKAAIEHNTWGQDALADPSLIQPQNYEDLDFGKSMFDKGVLMNPTQRDVQNLRAENEPWYAKIGAGIAKGTITAATTVIDGTLGLVDGLIEAAGTGDASKLWDNSITNCMNEVSKWQEEALPNYRTTEEEERPWWQNLGTANFWGDNFIKNLGFTVGAFYGGMGWMGALGALGKFTRVAQFLNTASKASKATKALVGAGISAVGEGSIEAINGRDEFIQNNSQSVEEETALRKQQALQEYERARAEGTNISIIDGQLVDTAYEKYKQDIAQIDQARENALAKINEDASHVGNMILAMNIPILTFGNIVQFGRIYAGGFNAARMGSRFRGGLRFGRDAAGRLTLTADYRPGTSKLHALLSAKSIFTEGNEEMAQKLASETSEDYYSTDVNAYYAKQFDPDASAETADWIKSMGRGWAKSYGDASSWEEGFIGGLTGALGMPKFRSATRTVTNPDGTTTTKRQSPVILQEGLWGGIRDYREARAREKKMTDAINAHINNPDYLNLWRSFIRSKAFQNDMDAAAIAGDVFGFKNAQFAQLVNDIELFKEMGKIDDLRELINQASDTSDDSIDDIINNTTSDPNITPESHNYSNRRRVKASNLEELRRQREQGRQRQQRQGTPTIEESMKPANKEDKPTGPFVDQDRDKIRQELTKGRDKILSTIDEYVKTSNKVDSDTGGVLTDEQLRYLTQLKLQTQDWQQRGGEIAEHIKTAATAVLPNITARIESLEQMLQDEKLDPAKKKERRYELQRMQELQSVLQEITNLSSATLAKKISLNKKKSFWNRTTDAYSAESIADLMSAVYHYDKNITFKGEVLDKNDLVKEIDDLVRMNQALETYNKKIAEYTGDPNKILTDQNKTKEEIAQVVKYSRKRRAYLAIQGAKNVKEFEFNLESSFISDEAQGLDFEGDLREEVLEDLIALGDEKAKELKEIDNYEKDVRAEIDKSQASQAVKDAAHQLLSEHRDASASLEALADPSLTYLLQDHYTSPLQEGEDTEDKELTDDYKEGMDILKQARVKVNNAWDNISARFGNKFLSPQQDARIVAIVDAILESNKRKAAAETESARDNTTTVPPVNEGTTIIGEGEIPDIDNTPIGAIEKDSASDSAAVKEENTELDEKVISDDRPTEENKDIPPRKMIITIIPYFDIDSKKNGIYVPFGERQTHTTDTATGEAVNFSYIYNHLIQRGAFKYVDDGKLKEGNSIGFMIDPEFEKGKYDENKHYPSELREVPTVFMVVKGGPNNGQIVGVLPSLSSQSHYWGLEDVYNSKGEVKYKGLISNLLDEYKAWDPSKNTGKVFISNKYTTKVSQMMIGSMFYTKSDMVLNSSASIDPSSIFGVTNGTVIQTNRPDLEGKVVAPSTITPGHLYLYVPNIRGTYSPLAIRARRLSETDFDIRQSSNIQEGSIGAEIKELINRLARAKDNDEVTAIWNALKEILYIENVKITFERTDAQGREYDQPRLNIDGIQRDANGEELKEGKDRHHVNLTGDEEKDAENILKTFEGFNLPIQIKASKINIEDGYNERLISSGVLTSNVANATIVGNWFTTDYYNPETGKFEPADRLEHKTPTVNSKNPSSPLTNTEAPTPFQPIAPTKTDNGSGIPGIKLEGEFPLPTSKGSKSYSGRSTKGPFYVDLKTQTVRDAQGASFSSAANEMILDIAYLQSVSNGNTEIPGVMHLSENTGKVFAVINRGEANQRVINVTERKYVYGKEANAIADWFTKQITPKPSTTTTTTTTSTTTTTTPQEESNTEVVSLLGRQDKYPFKDTDRPIFETQVTDFQIGDKIYRGATFEIGEVEGFPIRMAIFKEQRDPLEGEGNFGKIDVNMVYAIFPNGLAVPVYQYGIGDQELLSIKVPTDALDMLNEGFKDRPDDFKQLATKETLINKGQPQTKNTEGTEEQPEVRLDETDDGLILVVNNSRIFRVGDTVTFEKDGSTKRAVIERFIPHDGGTFVVELFEPETAAKAAEPVFLESESEIASLQKGTFTKEELRKESSEIYKNLRNEIDKIMHTSDDALFTRDENQLGDAYTESTSTITAEQPTHKKRRGVTAGLNQRPVKTDTTTKKTTKSNRSVSVEEEINNYEERPWNQKSPQEWLQEGNELYAMYALLDQYGKQDPEFQKLLDKVRKTYEALFPITHIFIRDILKDHLTGVEVPHLYGRYSNVNKGMLELRRSLFDSSVHNIQQSASIILHEMIHAVTSYALTDQEIIKKKLSPEQEKAVKELKRIYEHLKKDSSLQGEYGITNVHEMVAELANPEFRKKLKNIKLDKVSLWDRIVDAIREFFGIDSYEATSSLLEDLLDNYDQDLSDLYNSAAIEPLGYSELSQETKETLNKKGYTEEKFNSFPRGMKDHILKCVGF